MSLPESTPIRCNYGSCEAPATVALVHIGHEDMHGEVVAWRPMCVKHAEDYRDSFTGFCVGHLGFWQHEMSELRGNL